MKKLFLLLAFSLIGTFSYAQTAKEILSEIEGKWQVDDKGNVTLLKIIEAPGLKKEEIFNRSVNYFSYNYFDRRAEVQIQDKDSGLFVGKGIYVNVYINIPLTYLDAWHILRVDAKDGKARILITLTGYEKKFASVTLPEMLRYPGTPPYSTLKLIEEYPVNIDGPNKNIMAKAFYNSFKKANETLDSIEKAIKDGNTYQSVENSDW